MSLGQYSGNLSNEQKQAANLSGLGQTLMSGQPGSVTGNYNQIYNQAQGQQNPYLQQDTRSSSVARRASSGGSATKFSWHEGVPFAAMYHSHIRRPPPRSDV